MKSVLLIVLSLAAIANAGKARSNHNTAQIIKIQVKTIRSVKLPTQTIDTNLSSPIPSFITSHRIASHLDFNYINSQNTSNLTRPSRQASTHDLSRIIELLSQRR